MSMQDNKESKIVLGVIVGLSALVGVSAYVFTPEEKVAVPSMDFVADDRELITPIVQDFLPIIKPVDIATVEDLPLLIEETVEALPEIAFEDTLPEIAFEDTLPEILPPLVDEEELPPLQEEV